MKEEALTKLRNELPNIMEGVEKSVKQKKNATFEEMQVEIMKQQSTILLRHIMKRCFESEALCQAILKDHKSWDRCMKYVMKKAMEYAVGGSNGMVACIPDEQVYEWAEDYFYLDDKEEVEKEIEEAVKRQEEAKKRTEENERKEAMAREKAIEQLSAEEGWDELSEEEKEKKIKTVARNIKYSIGKSKTSTSKITSKKATKKENKTKAKNEKLEGSKEESLTADKSEDSYSKKHVPHREQVSEKEISSIVIPDNDGEQMNLFSMLSE